MQFSASDKERSKNMIDNLEVELQKYKVRNPDNFYCTTTKGEVLPYIDTLRDLLCYESIPSTGKYEAYKLKSYLRTPLGYSPARIEIRDIPFTWKRFRLIVNVSLPKVLYGHNVFEIYEHQFEEMIDAIYEMLLQFGVEINKEELRHTPHIRRVDFCKNILIETPVEKFITLLQKFKKPRSKTFSKYATTVTFGTKKKILVIYDKVKEVISRI